MYMAYVNFKFCFEYFIRTSTPRALFKCLAHLNVSSYTNLYKCKHDLTFVRCRQMNDLHSRRILIAEIV